MAKGYWIARIDVHNMDGYKDYVAQNGAVFAKFGARFLVRGGKTVPMHGTPPAQRVVIVQFESLEKAQAWANSAASKAAFAIGEKYGKLNDFIVEGVAP